MRILLTNDDGVHAPGLAAMYEALVDREGLLGGPLGEVVYPIAPLTVQSATGHGVTFHTPLMVDEEEVQLPGGGKADGVSVDGRPADCVKVAIANLWPERFGAGTRPDLVISGMNDGANCGINVIYSGTVAAALEAAFLGVPSIAVSMQRSVGKSNYRVGAAWARRTLNVLLARGLPRAHECLSVNVPLTDAPGLSPASPTPPLRVCAMNTHGLVDQYERRVSPGGAVYYWASGHGLDFRGREAGSDVDHLLHGRITVTPLMYDLTRREGLKEWEERIAGPAA